MILFFQKELYKKMFWFFIMAVNGGWDFEAKESVSIHHKKYSTRLPAVKGDITNSFPQSHVNPEHL